MMLERLLPDHEAIAAAIQDRSDKLTQQWTLEAHERFTGGCCATMYEIAKRTYDLGLHRFDVDEVMAWFEAVQLPRQRQIMETQGQRSNPIEVLEPTSCNSRASPSVSTKTARGTSVVLSRSPTHATSPTAMTSMLEKYGSGMTTSNATVWRSDWMFTQ